MITREQIEAVRDDVECAKPTECEVCEPIHAALDMAIAYLDSTRARRVGEAVLNVISGLSADDCDKIADDAHAGHVWDRDRLGLAHMMRTLAAALRGEP